ncbi:chromosome partitioning protein ParA, partial [Streptomyces nanshensis]
MTVRGLRLTPFQGLRYVPEKVSSLAAVTSPPYDVVVRPDGLRHLETADPYNIVRLILPQAEDPATRHRQAAETLRRWQDEGVLARDPQPALYVYEQRKGELLQRGLIGALRLSDPEEGIVLPHEAVMDEVVADRAELMGEMAANPEPLLLSYRG